jgi:hypothetical protein
MITFQDYIRVIQTGNIIKRCKIEWLYNEDEMPSNSFVADLISGSLTITRQNGIRRSVNITLRNIDGKYVPNEYSDVWINHKFKLWLGISINGEDFFLPQGVFVISDPELTSNCSESTISISAQDKFCLLDGTLGGSLESIYQIPVNTNIYQAIKSILVLAGDKISPILQSDFINEITPYTIRKEFGDGTYGNVLLDLAGMLSANIYYNVNGQLVFEKDINDSIKGSEWDFTTDTFHYLGATNKYLYSKVYNTVIVIGASINGNIATGKASNTNLQSDTRIQLIGEKVKPIEDSNIPTDDLAQQRSEYELKRAISVQKSIDIKFYPLICFFTSS